ncbi:MAG: prolipoprotein diacylglyceryl transferase [Patescibacteria group bacterium]
MFTWNIDPVLFSIGSLEIRYYGVFFASGLMLAYLLARKMCRIKNLSVENLDDLSVYLIIGLIVGARFGHIIFYESDYYFANPQQILKVWEGGLASHGAAIGTLLAYGIFLLRHKKVRVFDYADIIAVAACIPVSFIRLGNFFNSEIYGRVTDLPWAVTFSRIDDLSRHPSQIYEFLMGMLILAIMYSLWIRKSKTASGGFFFGLFFILYFAARFLVEFFKEYPLHENFFNLTTGQILSLPFFLFGCIIFIKSIHENNR